MENIRIISAILVNITAIALVKILYRRLHLSRYNLRKFIHMFVAFAVVAFSFVLTKREFVIITLVMTFLYMIIYYQNLLEELEPKNFKNYGLFLYPLGLLIYGIFLYDNPALLIAGVLVLGIPDAAASIFDHLRHKWHKTFLAGVVYFLFTVPILIFVFKPLTAIGFSIVLALVERLSRKGFDDLIIPIAYCALALTYANFYQVLI